MSDEGYMLRSRDREELARLEFQHRVWEAETYEVVRKAGFRPGDRLLDLGCGPGYLTLDLAERVGRAGSVRGIDTSDRFIEYLRGEAGRRGLDQVQASVEDVREFETGKGSLDGAICRWVLMFVAGPERVIERVAKSLRPGGVFASIEYTRFRSISLWPDGKQFRRLYEAVYTRIANGGGDADIGGRMPSLMDRAGFEIVDVLPFWRVGRPGSDLWQGLEHTHVNHPDLVQEGLLTSEQLDAYLQEWREHSENHAALYAAPPVLATIGRRR